MHKILGRLFKADEVSRAVREGDVLKIALVLGEESSRELRAMLERGELSREEALEAARTMFLVLGMAIQEEELEELARRVAGLIG